MNKEQLQNVAIYLANSVHCALAWEESLNMDEIDCLCKEFRKELKQLNGED